MSLTELEILTVAMDHKLAVGHDGVANPSEDAGGSEAGNQGCRIPDEMQSAVGFQADL